MQQSHHKSALTARYRGVDADTYRLLVSHVLRLEHIQVCDLTN